MNSDALKTWYNTNFFNGEAPKEATVAITIQAQNATVYIPGINVFADSTIYAIVKAWYEYLKENPQAAALPDPAPMPEASKLPEPTAPEIALVDFEQVTFRENRYMVERYADDTYKIKNLETNNEVNPESPNGKAIIKRMAQELH